MVVWCLDLKIKAVIFDVDGTLLDTYRDLANAVNFALIENGLPTHSSEKYKYFCGNGTEKMIERALPEDKRDDALIAHLKKYYLDFYNKHTGEETRVYDGIQELLSTLKQKGIKMGVVSNKIDCMVQQVIPQYFGDCFDFVTGQRDGIPAKPDPALVFEAMKALGVESSECIFVGDSGVDAMTGSRSGAFMVGVLWGFRDRDELVTNGADAVISTPMELLEYIV
ncbi:MAG: HAD family hydrolase [Ruminococcaceae bacterium]|nr:HAD family hydrolase [Oscillospiraceae bacterium]